MHICTENKSESIYVKRFEIIKSNLLFIESKT